MVDDVAQFSVRGGIFDIYGSALSDPVRLEFWGDEIVELAISTCTASAPRARRTSRSSCRRWPRARRGRRVRARLRVVAVADRDHRRRSLAMRTSSQSFSARG
jgi:hypothetical protein